MKTYHYTSLNEADAIIGVSMLNGKYVMYIQDENLMLSF